MFEWNTISITDEEDTPRIIQAWKKYQGDLTRVPMLDVNSLEDDIRTRARVIIELSK